MIGGRMNSRFQLKGKSMKRLSGFAVWAMACGFGLAGLSGCGGSSSSQTTTTPPASITSFVASPATITDGQSATLTGVFANGTGVITPGNLAASTGTAVTVSPTVTTTYTLTVTPASGAAVTATATITVNPAPSITSFVASPTTITAGGSATLTGVFANGTGVITPGNLSATTGVGVTVSPTATTTYTLTVTPVSGTAITATAIVTVQAAPPPTTTISVNESTLGPAISDQLIGMNMAMWADPTISSIQTAFAAAGVKAVRWPGGSNSDLYNWEDNTECQGGYSDPNSNFTTYVNNFVKPSGVDLALTADYGTGKNCTGAGDPTEAAAWAAEALTLGVTVSHMTVGNEEYGSWEYDGHTPKNDPTTYAAAVVGSSGYYKLIKAASPNTLVGVVADAQSNCCAADWDSIVLGNAAGYYDFVEFHYYPQNPGGESDTYLVNKAAQDFTTNINTLKAELKTAGEPDTPIYVGEMGSVSSNPGKQSLSITQGLYAGQLLGEMMNDGITRGTWWISFDNCNGTAGNDSASLYGWQDFGGYNVFSDGPSDTGCAGAGAIGTMSPTAVAYQLFSNVAVTGQNVLTPTVTGDTTDIRAYAATSTGGTALVLFNLNETTSEPVTITLSGQSTASSVNVISYDKATYDLSGSPTGFFPDPAGTSTWAGPTTTPLGAQSLPLTITLTPWSMNVVMIQ